MMNYFSRTLRYRDRAKRKSRCNAHLSEKCEHEQAVSTQLGHINAGVDQLEAVASAMSVELRRQSERLGDIQTTATAVTEQAELNNTRAARFLRKRH